MVTYYTRFRATVSWSAKAMALLSSKFAQDGTLSLSRFTVGLFFHMASVL